MTSAIDVDMSADGYQVSVYNTCNGRVLRPGALGWQFNIELLKRLSPFMVAMNPVTALTFFVLRFSLTAC